ncbi:hypothetical protein DENSPDRAFT_748067, partial [Dentipellis sp. KUC8613]
RKVWLKDSWRIALDEIEKEYAVYAKLRAKDVPNVAEMLCGGDVVGGPGQRTLTPDYVDAPWRRGEVDILPHCHYRLVLGSFGRPLKDFRSTKELVGVVRDALVAHWEAFSRAGVLHRDISGGNILIVQDDKTTHGVLIDWDMSKDMTVDAPSLIKWRIGTWRFMSAAILRQSDKPHEYCDDLESFEHVITYHILRYRP